MSFQSIAYASPAERLAIAGRLGVVDSGATSFMVLEKVF
jgi:hypothetical protein